MEAGSLKLCIFAPVSGFRPFCFSMDKHIFNFKDQRLDAGIAKHCGLAVVVGTESFAFTCTGPDGDTLALAAWPYPLRERDSNEEETELRKIFGAEPMLSYTFETVRCAFFNRNATLVPSRMFDADKLAAYFKLLLPEQKYEYGFDILPEFECFLVYAVPPSVKHICKQYFPEARLMHLATPLLKNFRSLSPPNDYGVFVNIRNRAAQIVVLDRQNLLYYNTCTFSKPGDLLYFVLLAYDQFRLRPEDIPLTVSGLIAADSDLFRLLSRYLRETRFIHPLPSFPTLPKTEAGPGHYWFDLYSAASIH